MDTGCTKCMGSRKKVMAFVQACKSKGSRFNGWFEFRPSNTKFSFANSEGDETYEKLVIHYNTDPPTSTEIDILEKGNAPILFSLDQMRNLRMTIELSPEVDLLTCHALGMVEYPISY